MYRRHYDDPDYATSSSSNIITGKRRRSNQATIIQESSSEQYFAEQIQLFHQKQSNFFDNHPNKNINLRGMNFACIDY